MRLRVFEWADGHAIGDDKLVNHVCVPAADRDAHALLPTDRVRATDAHERTHERAREAATVSDHGIWHRHIKSERGTNSQQARGAHNLR